MAVFLTIFISYIILTIITLLIGRQWPKIEEDVSRPPIVLCFAPIFQIVIIALAAYAYIERKSTRLGRFISKHTQGFQDWYYND